MHPRNTGKRPAYFGFGSDQCNRDSNNNLSVYYQSDIFGDWRNYYNQWWTHCAYIHLTWNIYC